MADSSEQSPFAEFATPKRSAVEQWREQQYQSRAARWKALRAALCFFVGSAAGATVGVSLKVGFDRLGYLFPGALAGGALGLGAGLVIGCACFSVMAMSGTSRKPSYEAEVARKDPMAVINVLLVAWALIGVTVGSMWGALAGLAWDGSPHWQNAMDLWGFIGSILGSALMIPVWLAWEARRRARARARLLQGMPFTEPSPPAARPPDSDSTDITVPPA
jgi:hypothetical protein